MSNLPPPPGSDQPTGSGEPTPPNPYGAPQPPAYGAPQPPAYGAPVPGQPPAGPPYPGYGQPGAEQPKGKGLAITAFILAFIPCVNIVSVVLALIVLIGKRAGKGLAIAALVITPLIIVAAAVLVVLLGTTPIDDLKTGECFTADGLTGDDSDISAIQVVDCTDSHDAQVLTVHTLDGSEADAYDISTGSAACDTAIPDDLLAALPEGVIYTALTQSAEPESGDHLVCVAYRTDGKSLSEKLG